MERRKFLIGAGTAAVGSSALIGSGAFTAMDAERDANIDVVTDPDSLIGLEPGSDAGNVVGISDNPGELYIDFTSEEGGEGVNVNSRYQVGTFHHTHDIESRHIIDTHSTTMGAWGYAFSVNNQSDESRDITLAYEADQEVEGYLGFGFEHNGWTKKDFEITGSQTTGSVTFTDVQPGEKVLASFVVSTLDVDDYADEDLSGKLSVSAE